MKSGEKVMLKKKNKDIDYNISGIKLTWLWKGDKLIEDSYIETWC